MTPPDRAHAGVVVEAPARLHFGMLDLRGDLGRRFGGIGAAVPDPSVLIEVQPAPDLSAEGPDAARALDAALRFRACYGLSGGAKIRLHRVIPAHAGLGSGTQLALAVGKALAELNGLRLDVTALARAVGRGQRSAIGTWLFAYGGFVLEGGRRDGAPGPAPLLARLPMPERWHCILAVPPGDPGLSGAAETEAFGRLCPPPASEVGRVAHVVLMQLLPALAEGDLPAFGEALTAVQRLTGGWFAAVQGGGRFAPGLTRRLVDLLEGWGAHGVGQSSWGPAVYGIVEGFAQAEDLSRRLHGEGITTVVATPFASQGAVVRWADGAANR